MLLFQSGMLTIRDDGKVHIDIETGHDHNLARTPHFP